MLSVARRRALDESGAGAEDGQQRGGHAGQREGQPDRVVPREEPLLRTRPGVDERLPSGLVLRGAGAAPCADRTRDQPRRSALQHLRREPELFQRARSQVLHQEVGLVNEVEGGAAGLRRSAGRARRSTCPGSRRRSGPGRPRRGSPPGRSTLTTSAPRSAKIVAASGAATYWPISTTLRPRGSAPAQCPPDTAAAVRSPGMRSPSWSRGSPRTRSAMTLRCDLVGAPADGGRLGAEQLVGPPPALGIGRLPRRGVHPRDLDRDDGGLLHQLRHGQLQHRRRRPSPAFDVACR